MEENLRGVELGFYSDAVETALYFVRGLHLLLLFIVFFRLVLFLRLVVFLLFRLFIIFNFRRVFPPPVFEGLGGFIYYLNNN